MASRAVAERATVRLTPPDEAYVGSGTVVSDDGLVLTNAHVAAPRAPGLADLYGRRSAAADPPYLVVGVPSPGGGPVAPTFRASVLAVDGYVDLAVLRIDATLDGRRLRAGQRFASIPLSRSSGLAVGDRIEVLGHPVARPDGARPSSAEGRVVGFAPDPTGRVPGERFWIDSSAPTSGGFSGGAVVDTLRGLVAVPSAELDGAQAFGRARPVELAGPLLAAAAAGRPYVSPYVVHGTGAQRARQRGWGRPGQACEDLTATRLDAGIPAVAAGAQFSGMSRGEDVLFVLSRAGDARTLASTRTTWGPGGPDGCLSTSFAASAVGFASGFPRGDYLVRVQVGPRLTEVGRLRLVVR